MKKKSDFFMFYVQIQFFLNITRTIEKMQVFFSVYHKCKDNFFVS